MDQNMQQDSDWPMYIYEIRRFGINLFVCNALQLEEAQDLNSLFFFHENWNVEIFIFAQNASKMGLNESSGPKKNLDTFSVKIG